MANNELFPPGAALVIGASGGIGGVCAQVLADDGSAIAACYHSRAEPVADLADRIVAAGGAASTHQLDVSDEQSIAQAIGEAIERHGRIHTLVWAAGPLVEQMFLSETPLAAWRKAFDIEVHGLFCAMQAILPHMREQGGGSVVHLGSAGHLRWPDRDGLSVAPKAANESFLKGIAREEGKHGIRANSVLVGVIDAGMFRELSQQGQFPPEWIEQTQLMLAVKRWGQPEEIGYAVSFLASNRAAYVTGQQINVSGGFGL